MTPENKNDIQLSNRKGICSFLENFEHISVIETYSGIWQQNKVLLLFVLVKNTRVLWSVVQTEVDDARSW